MELPRTHPLSGLGPRGGPSMSRRMRIHIETPGRSATKPIRFPRADRAAHEGDRSRAPSPRHRTGRRATVRQTCAFLHCAKAEMKLALQDDQGEGYQGGLGKNG